MPSPKNKALPSLPSCQTSVEKENIKLKDRVQLLEGVIEILYRQTLCYINTLDQRKDLEKGLDRTIALCKSEMSALERRQKRIKNAEMQAMSDWSEYCEGMVWETGDVVGQFLEDIKMNLIRKELGTTMI